jgi:competence protein CoiA
MRFAIINDKRVKAESGLRGFCPRCSKPVIAKCGIKRIHHWAHLNKRTCDSWHEPETEWHLQWKNIFPDDWQECCMYDEQTGEKHIADVRSSEGLVIEFQHSHIHAKERTAREKFYKNMVWVVDGTRLKGDYPRFLKGKKYFNKTNKQGIFLLDFPEVSFQSDWLGSLVPVIFDFRGIEKIEDPEDIRNDLYMLFPKGQGKAAILARLSCKAFIDAVNDGKFLWWVRNFMNPTSQKRQIQIRVPLIRRQESPYILERGNWKRRKRL